MKKIFFTIALAIALLISVAGVFADHMPNIDIDPDVANCEQLGNIFTVTVENDAGSSDSILQVEIYKALAGVTNSTFECGDAPDDWDLFSYTDRCIYVTELDNPEKIAPNESLDFTFEAVMTSNTCASKFVAVTIDDENTTGQRKTKDLFVNIDCSPPVIIKNMGDPSILMDESCDPDTEICDYWITQDTPIFISVFDNTTFNQCNLGLGYCNITYTVDGGPVVEETLEYFDDEVYFWDYDWDFDEDSEHIIDVTCYDMAGNMRSITELDRVDSTPPTTTKSFSGPQKIEDGVEWIDGVTTIELTESDGGPICAIGTDNTYYRIVEAQDAVCWNSCSGWQTSNPSADGSGDWIEYVGPIGSIPQSCHVMEYYSVDDLGNIETVNVNCFFVDKTPPMINKCNGEAIFDTGEAAFESEDNPDGDFHWLTTSMPVTFTCDDTWNGEAEHPSEDEMLCFNVLLDDVPIVNGTFAWRTITEDYCDGSLNDDGFCCVPVDPETKEYEFFFREESMHRLEYYCEDAVEKNTSTHTQFYKVDDTPPSMVGDVVITGPNYAVSGDCPPSSETDECHLDGITTLDLDWEDGGDICAVGEVVCEWDYRVDGGIWTKPRRTFPINFPEESEHDLRVRCEDALGNSVVIYEATYFVDKTAPHTDLVYVGPQFPDPIVLGQFPHWIDTVTNISLSATDDVGDHDSGVADTWVRVTQVDDVYCESAGSGCSDAEGAGEYTEYSGPFGINESCHLIEYYSVDNVNKTEEPKRDCVFSDHTAPVANISYEEDMSVECEEGNPFGCSHYISQNTNIELACQDVGPHPSNGVTIFWEVYVESEPGVWNETPIHEFSEEGESVDWNCHEDSRHKIKYWCVDAVGKMSEVNEDIVVVDTVAPNITKTVTGPWVECEEEQLIKRENSCEGECEPMDCYMVDSATEVTFDVTDPEPHPVDMVRCDIGYEWWSQEGYQGIFHAEWNGTEWVSFEGADENVDLEGSYTFSFPEESEHILYAECWDALGNTAYDVERFLVDKTPPYIWKEYEASYVDEFENYWAKWINVGIPIYAGAIENDENQPHPTGIKEVKYKVSIVEDENCRYPYEKRELYDYSCDEASEGDWMTVPESDWDEFVFNISEESCHMIEIMATDNVDKCALHKQFVFVDNTAPLPNKTVGEPKSEMSYTSKVYGKMEGGYDELDPDGEDICSSEEGKCWDVTVLTPIELACVDPEPHPSGAVDVCFKVELDGHNDTESYCSPEDMTEDGFCCIEGPVTNFYFAEESIHKLSYYCVDNVGNQNPEELDVEYFKVKGSAFQIELNGKWNLISVPVKLLDNSMDEIFAGLEDVVDSVWTYDAGVWSVYSPDGLDNDDLTTMQPGWGYWVLTNLEKGETEMLTIGGNLFSEGITPPERNIVDGWNLIGYYGTEGAPWVNEYGFWVPPDTEGAYPGYYGPMGAGLSVEDELNSLMPYDWDTSISSIFGYWDDGSQHFFKPTGFYGLCYENKMDPGAGYWIYKSNGYGFVPPSCAENTYSKFGTILKQE